MSDLVDSLRNIEEDIAVCNIYLLPYRCLYFYEFYVSIVACLLWKPSRWSGIPGLSIIMEILGNISFSNSFDRTGSSRIGLYDSANSADFPGFWIIIISTIFHWGGKKPLSRTSLHSWVMYFIPISGSNIWLVMRS